MRPIAGPWTTPAIVSKLRTDNMLARALWASKPYQNIFRT